HLLYISFIIIFNLYITSNSHHITFSFFTDTSTTEIYTLSLHDALPIYRIEDRGRQRGAAVPADTQSGARLLAAGLPTDRRRGVQDRKSTRLNSSHVSISYAVFCLKKKKILLCQYLYLYFYGRGLLFDIR